MPDVVAAFIFPVVVHSLVAWWGSSISRGRGRLPAEGACLGFFLGFIGLGIAALLPSRWDEKS